MDRERRRGYQSPLRAAHVQATRERLLEAAYAILAEDPVGVSALTFQRVATQAEVSVPTVYRHFRDQATFLAAFVDWIRPWIGLDPTRVFSLALDEMPELPAESFPRFEEHGTVLRALIDSREANQARAAAVTDRAERAATSLSRHAPDWDKEDLKAVTGAIAVLQAPPTWRWLRDTWGLDADTTRIVASWAIRALVAAVKLDTSLMDNSEEGGRAADTGQGKEEGND